MRRLASLRRVVAASFALLLLLQSSGSGLAASAQIPFSLPTSALGIQIANALSALEASQIGALLSGNDARWQAMHAPPPVFHRESPPMIVPPPRRPSNDTRHFFIGVLRAGPHMLSQPLRPGETPKDPRAITGRGFNPITRSCVHVAGRPCATVSIRRNGVRTLSITPTVQPFLFEADTTSAPTTLFASGGHESGAISNSMDSAPPRASTNETLTFTPYSGAMSFGWISPANVPNSTSWPAQTYTVSLNVTQPNPNLKITEITLYRVDANGGPGTAGLAHVADKSGLSQTLGTAGTVTFTLTGSAQTASATDRFGVKFIVSYSGTTTSSFSYLAGQNSGSGVNLSNAPAIPVATTGINRWWTYEEGALPGHGKYMVNVGNGNLIVQANDVDISERGIDLAFRRTYNAQSTHDSNNTDGSEPANYGDGWTNTFDAHLAYDGANTINLYDIDGARYDYTADGNGGWTPPAGQYAALKWDGSCGYQWTKKTGTVYYFYSPDLNETSNCTMTTVGTYPQDSAYGGRLYKIWGRNSNNFIAFTYKWVNNDSSTAANLAEIDATHPDGHGLTLTFGTQISGGPKELVSVKRPDGQVINYYYDGTTGATLQQVILPGNGSQSTLTESYGYSNGHQLVSVGSPRYNANSADGDVTNFQYDASTTNRVTEIFDTGLVNFVPASPDPSVVALQSGSTAPQTWRIVNYSGYGTGTTSMTDHDGHATNWSIDSSFRVTQTSEATGETSPLPTYLVKTQKWDNNNNLLEITDARGNPTDFAYDTNGNTVAVALASVTISGGTFRPTSLYSYDNYNNVTSYCDAVANHPNRDWNPSTPPTPTPAACPTSTPGPGVVYRWDYSDTTYEPYGRLSNMYTQLGYHTQITYDSSKQSDVDAGLPTTVQAAAAINQNDGSTRTPTQLFTYDQYGNLITYSKGVGNWALSYDTLNNRLTSASDPTGVTSYKYYNNDGSLSKTETAYQHATGTGSTFAYDADGDVIRETVSHGGSYVNPTPGPNPTPTPLLNAAAATTKFYDGADRLVEVVQPQDGADVYTKPWVTRYIYDLSQNGKSSVYAAQLYNGTQALSGHGNLVKTQEYVPQGQTVTTRVSSLAPTQFVDLKGQSFDPLDRLTAKLQLVNTGGASDVVNKDTTSYDGGGYYGLVSSSCNALNVCATPTYDTLNQLLQESYSDSTPTRTFTYDADGRRASVSNTYATYSYVYDADGRQVQSAETLGPGGTSLTAPATLTRHYYADGKLSSLDASSLAFTQSALLSYAYRVDDVVSWQQVNDGSIAGIASSGSLALAMQYDSAGRMTSLTESGAGANSTPTTATYNAFGNAVSKVYPGGTLGSIEYDASGAPLGYEPTWPNQATFPIVKYSYTARGELRGDASGDIYSTFANGASISQQYPSKTPQLYQTIDPAMSVVVAHSNVPPRTDPATVGTYSSVNESFDGAGQMTQVATEEDTNYATCQTLTSANRQFDALNRTTSETYSYDNTSCTGPFTHGSASYDWGANDHPVGIGSGFETTGSSPPPISGWDTLHWDGGQLLFTTNGSGHVDDIKVGTFADIIPSVGIVFYDRGFGTNISYCHTSSSVYGNGAAYHNLAYTVACGLAPGMLWQGSPPAPVTQQDSGGVKNGVGNGGLLANVNGDGWGDDYNTIQGIRSVDSLTSVWTTPDAYAGEVHDPMSQKPFMWNHNNPLQYDDPTGYYVFDNGTKAQQQAFDDAAKALDKKVREKMAHLGKNTTLYKALSSFHEDLQKGSGNWHIQFGSSNDPQSGGYTHVTVDIKGEQDSRILGVGSTVIDTARNSTRADWAAALAQEGGIYEIASGRAGAGAKADLAEAMWMDNGTMEFRGPGVAHQPSDMAMDRVVNALFNIPLGVQPDN